MPRPSQLPLPQVRRWATAHVAQHPKDFTRAMAQAFGVTRAAAGPAVRQLELEAFVLRSGSSTRPVFAAGPSRFIEADLAMAGLDESTVWEEQFAPHLSLPPNVENVVHYGLTEMINNAIDHSAGQHLSVRCAVAGGIVYLGIADDGIGVFECLSRAFGLGDHRLAVLELSKGRVTTDPTRHSGEGIFFTSRAFSVFRMLANGLAYERRNQDLDLAKPSALRPPIALPTWPAAAAADSAAGTRVTMALRADASLVLRDLFAQYTTGAPDDLSFDRTVIPVRLARLGTENLISRSQAKRLLARIERFKLVELDFDGVPEIGQGFADEVFRVFALAHPAITLKALNAGPGVAPMIRRVTSG